LLDLEIPLPLTLFNSLKIPSINQDYSLDLSILLSEGKETKKDSQSNCE